jgi:hypothetical protein
MVQAHGQFSNRISRLTFVSQFYETLLGASNIESLLDSAAAAIGARVGGSNVAIFLMEPGGFDIHYFKSPECTAASMDQIERWFSTETVREISMSSQVCGVSRMLTMGLMAGPKELKQVSMAAVPLGTLGQAAGFVLLWRGVDKPLRRAELEAVAAVSSGLRCAIRSRSKSADAEVEVKH